MAGTPPPGFAERFQRITGIDKGKKIRPLARELGLSPQSIYDYRDGLSTPGDATLAKLHEKYGTDPQWLLYGDRDPEKPPETPAQLKGWAGELASRLDHLGDYVEKVINTEVERRLLGLADALADAMPPEALRYVQDRSMADVRLQALTAALKSRSAHLAVAPQAAPAPDAHPAAANRTGS